MTVGAWQERIMAGALLTMANTDNSWRKLPATNTSAYSWQSAVLRASQPTLQQQAIYIVELLSELEFVEPNN